jgi:hypothetical protein
LRSSSRYPRDGISRKDFPQWIVLQIRSNNCQFLRTPDSIWTTTEKWSSTPWYTWNGISLDSSINDLCSNAERLTTWSLKHRRSKWIELMKIKMLPI